MEYTTINVGDTVIFEGHITGRTGGANELYYGLVGRISDDGAIADVEFVEGFRYKFQTNSFNRNHNPLTNSYKWVLAPASYDLASNHNPPPVKPAVGDPVLYHLPIDGDGNASRSIGKIVFVEDNECACLIRFDDVTIRAALYSHDCVLFSPYGWVWRFTIHNTLEKPATDITLHSGESLRVFFVDEYGEQQAREVVIQYMTDCVEVLAAGTVLELDFSDKGKAEFAAAQKDNPSLPG